MAGRRKGKLESEVENRRSADIDESMILSEYPNARIIGDRVFLSAEEANSLSRPTVLLLSAADSRPQIADHLDKLNSIMGQFISESTEWINTKNIDNSQKRVILLLLRQYSSGVNKLAEDIALNTLDPKDIDVTLSHLVDVISVTSTLSSLVRRNIFDREKEKNSAQRARIGKSKKSEDARARAREAADTVRKTAPVYFKTATTLAKEILRRGEAGEPGGVSGIGLTTLRSYVTDKCGSRPVPRAK
jgi:hypothetical protein